MQLTNLLTAILLLFFTTTVTAQSFDILDESFGASGRVVVDMTDNSDSFQTMCLQSDGKILMAGADYYGYEQNIDQQSSFAIVRLNTDGSLDDTFGDGGQVITTLGYTREVITTMKVMSSGKILVAGYVIEEEIVNNRRINKVVLLRYFSDGRLDETFGEAGSLILAEETISIYTSIIELPDSDKFLLSNYNGKIGSTNGSSFIQVFNLIGFNESGKVDTIFGINGYMKYDREVLEVDCFDGVAVHNNQIYLTGTKSVNNFDNIALVRLDLKGQLDTLFGEKGIATVDFGYSGGAYAQKIAFQSDNSVVVLGAAIRGPKRDFALTRFTSNGQVDKTFGMEGIVTTEFTNYTALAIQSDDMPIDLFIEENGGILAFGASTLSKPLYTTAIAKYTSNGQLDATFGKKGKLLLQNYNSSNYLPRIFLIQDDNKIIFGGTISREMDHTDYQLIRFGGDFNVNTFNPSIIANRIEVYPNPIQHTTTLTYTLEKQEDLTIQLTNLNGQLLKTYLKNESQKAGTYQQQIDLPTDLPTGMYIVRLVSPKGQLIIKVTK